MSTFYGWAVAVLTVLAWLVRDHKAALGLWQSLRRGFKKSGKTRRGR